MTIHGHNVARHEDHVWEVELADQVHRWHIDERSGHAGQLWHHLRSLRRHYKTRVPQELSEGRLPSHATFVQAKHKRISGLVLQLICPTGERCRLATGLVKNAPERRAHFHIACVSHHDIETEMYEVERYWAFIASRARLPYRCALWLHRYNDRPIAHPWEALAHSTLDHLADISGEIDRRLQ